MAPPAAGEYGGVATSEATSALSAAGQRATGAGIRFEENA